MKITTLFVWRQEGYTTNMSFFVHATEAVRPKTKSIEVASLVLAAFLILMAVGQLFTYEKFAEVIKGLGFTSNDVTASLVAALLVVFEVAAVPFLLRMRLSPLARFLSMLSGWMVLVFWISLSLWLNFTLSMASNAGVLGDTIKLPAGIWMVTFFIALIALDGCASYGMWPVTRKSKKS